MIWRIFYRFLFDFALVFFFETHSLQCPILHPPNVHHFSLKGATTHFWIPIAVCVCD